MPGKVKYYELSESDKKKFLGEFYSMVASLKTREEVKNFLKDLLTLSETVMLSRRIQVAKMLLEGVTHEEIKKELKVGFTTISNVERWLNNGFGGYKKVLEEYRDNIDKSKNKKRKKQFRESMLNKYPHHKFLLNLLGK